MPVSLFNDDKLIAKTSVSLEDNAETIFSIPTNQMINGRVTINDASLQFDNTLYFNINRPSKINVLTINGDNDAFLKRIFTAKEFNYTSTPERELDYNLIDKQHLIVLNELKHIPVALNAAIKQFTDQGSAVIVIPAKGLNTQSYNSFLGNYNAVFSSAVASKKQVTTINYSHPLYSNGVFEKQVTNFQYPKVSSFHNMTSTNGSSVLKFEDGKIFLSQNKNTFIFASALNKTNSSFKNSPLIVPTLYNIAKQSFKIPELYYTVGKENRFDVNTKMQQDAVLSLNKDAISIIPKQQYFNNKVMIETSEEPAIAGIYELNNKAENVKNISYNFSRTESKLDYKDLSALKHVNISESITEIFDTIKSDTKVNALWKWFAIFALALLIIEMGILKFFK